MISYGELAFELLNLSEDVEQDREYRETARDIYRKLKDALENYKENLLNKAEGGYWVDGNNIGYSAFIFYFAPKDHTAGYKKYKDYHMIKIPALTKDGSAENLEFRLHSNKRTIIHEIIHALDNMRFDKSMGTFYDVEERGGEKYWNSPNEYNAYFQDAANELEEFINHMTTYEFEAFEDSFKSFEKFKDWAFDKFFHDEFLDNLNSKYKKKLLKRLYKLYDKFKQEGKLNKNRYE